MEVAVAKFRKRMATANRCFLDARIAEQRGMPMSMLSRTDGMVRYWFRWNEAHDGWDRLVATDAPDQLKQQARSEAAVKDLDDVERLPHYHMDGTEPPCDEESQLRYLDELQEVLRAYADRRLLQDQLILLPAQFRDLLRCTNGIFDPDFRHSGICDLSLPQYPGKAVQLRPVLEAAANRSSWPAHITQEFDVAAGIMLDMKGQWPELWPHYRDGRWYSFYAYCQAARPGASDGMPFAWRVVFYHQKTASEHEMWSFTTITEFLEWYASWEDRFDEDAMDRAVSEKPPGHENEGATL